MVACFFVIDWFGLLQLLFTFGLLVGVLLYWVCAC